MVATRLAHPGPTTSLRRVAPEYAICQKIQGVVLRIWAVALRTGRRPLSSSVMTFNPFHFFAVAIAGWMNRQQQDVIICLREENRILREKLGLKRLILNDNQKRRLAEAAANLGRDLLRSPASSWTCV